MAHRRPPTSTFHKYFPELAAPSGGDPSHAHGTPQDLFPAPHLPASRFASLILEGGGGARSFFRGSAAHAFANITQPVAPEACSTSGDRGDLLSAEVGGGLGKGDDEEPRSRPRRRSTWNDMPKFLLAGTVSTIISRTCVAPLERIKLECIIQGKGQSLPEIVRWIWASEGARGFWKGNLLNLFRTIPFKSINFLCYDMYCDCLLHLPGKTHITSHDRLLAGAISGLAATALCLPLDTIRMRLIAPGGEALGGVEGCFFHMVRNEGFLSLYKGLAPALISMGPASAVFYTVYDMLKAFDLSRRRRRRRRRREADDEGSALEVLRTLVYGAVAGACAETVTYPLEVIRRQLQLQQSSRLGMASAFAGLIQSQGVGSLFAGLLPSTLQVLPSAALSYLFYELMKSVLKIS